MIHTNKLKEYASNMSDVELVNAVSHLNDYTFSDDNVIRLMFNYAIDKDDDYGLIMYLPSITKVLCDEAIERMKIYSPHIEKN